MNVIILLIMCIAKMLYLALPTLLCAIGIQVVIYRLTGFSPINKIVKVLSK